MVAKTGSRHRKQDSMSPRRRITSPEAEFLSPQAGPMATKAGSMSAEAESVSPIEDRSRQKAVSRDRKARSKHAEAVHEMPEHRRTRRARRTSHRMLGGAGQREVSGRVNPLSSGESSASSSSSSYRSGSPSLAGWNSIAPMSHRPSLLARI